VVDGQRGPGTGRLEASSTAMAELVPEAEELAGILTRVVNGTVTSNVSFVVTPLAENPDLAWVFPEGSTPAAPILIPVTCPAHDAEPLLWINATFQVRLDESEEHLAVQQSVFSLVVDERTKRPVIRLEYERGAGTEPDDEVPGGHRRSAAHVQIHGASEELAYVQGINRQSKLRGLEHFHIPVGGRRCRPSVEDFIEFLHAERLIPALNTGWRDVVREHRARWLAIQLKAAVRDDPETAAEQLMAMGYSTQPPGGQS